MRNYILLTGATGLLGQYLTRDLMDQGERMAVLVRPTKKQTAHERVEQYMQMWERETGRTLQRPVVISGDITQEDLGLSAEDREWVGKHCTTMLHCAASLTFHEYRGEPWRTNIDGTKHVLQLCEDLKITEMHYISTAYVCGHRHDLVKETDLDVQQEFRNDYEKSKFKAEQLVRASKAFTTSLTVYRPVVITGDGITGYTSTYHGTYLYMRLAALLAQRVEPNENGERHVPVRWGLTGDERRNITSVDWNSTIICQLMANPEAHGRTFHMAPCDPISMGEAITYATDFYGLTGIEFRGYGPQADHPLNDLERWLWSNISIYGSYDFMDPQFDTTNLMEFAPTPACPKLDKDMAMRLMDYAEADRWGKRKKTAPTPSEICVAEYLRENTVDADAAESVAVGIEAIGAGGGPQTVKISADGKLVDHHLGLPDRTNAAPLLQIPTTQLAELKKSGGDLAELLKKLVEQEEVGDSSA